MSVGFLASMALGTNGTPNHQLDSAVTASSRRVSILETPLAGELTVSAGGVLGRVDGQWPASPGAGGLIGGPCQAALSSSTSAKGPRSDPPSGERAMNHSVP